MSGFFTRKETTSLATPENKVYSCVSCGLYKHCDSPRMKPYGNFKKEIMVLGEAPGLEEDRLNMPFQGKSGKLLERTLQDLHINLFEDCIVLNAISCHPKNNRTPDNFEIDNCRRFVIKAIQEYKPKVIIPLGTIALSSLIGHRWKKDFSGINKWRGFRIPDQDYHSWACPTFHPSFVERMDSKEFDTIWRDDLLEARNCLNIPFPEYNEPNIKVLDNLSVLDEITSDEVAVDFETTSLKPQDEENKIICCSVAFSEDHVFAFMIPETRRELLPLIGLLKNPSIGKIAANCKFEYSWAKVKLNTEIQNFVWDTMLASHVLDNRSGITNLAFQSYVNLGVIDFKDETDPYMKSKEKGGNAQNTVRKLIATNSGKEKLLRRNALDSIYEFRIANIQRNLIQLPF